MDMIVCILGDMCVCVVGAGINHSLFSVNILRFFFTHGAIWALNIRILLHACVCGGISYFSVYLVKARTQIETQ